MPDMQPSEILARIPGELMNAHTTGAIHAVINRAEKAITAHQRRAVIEGEIDSLKRLKQTNGAVIGIGGKRVDNMVHHTVIDEHIEALEAELGEMEKGPV